MGITVGDFVSGALDPCLLFDVKEELSEALCVLIGDFPLTEKLHLDYLTS